MLAKGVGQKLLHLYIFDLEMWTDALWCCLLNIEMPRVEVWLCVWRIESKLVHVLAVCSNCARISEPPEETVSCVHWPPQPDPGMAGAPQAQTATITIIQKRLHVIIQHVKAASYENV